MNLRTWSNRNKSLALVAALGFAAPCTISDLTEPGQHQLGSGVEMALDLALAGGVPRGPLTLEAYRLVVDTVGQTDVFQRAGADGYYSSTRLRYIMDTGVRIAGQDPRLPALAPVYAPEEFSTNFAHLWGPERYGDDVDVWDFYMQWRGLGWGLTYTYSIERLATIVNGSLDALEFFIEGEVTEPDQLIPLDGAPGGYPDNDYYWTNRAGCAAEPIPDPPPNPWYLGLAREGAYGSTADFCFGTPWFWYDGSVNVPDSSISMPNELRRGPVPQYNYAVVYKGEPPNLGPPIIRIQMGVDLDTNGNPIPNGFAPFPLTADREAAATLPHVGLEPIRVRFEIQDLEPLDGGARYELWLVNQEDGSSSPATADYFTIETIILTDELGQQNKVDVPSEDTVRTSTFNGLPDANIRHALIVSNRTLAGPTLGEFTHVTLARPGSSGALTDPVMWAQYLNRSGTPEDPSDDILVLDDDLKFGRLDPADPPASRTFRATGSGTGLVVCEASRSVHEGNDYLGEQCLENRSSLNLHFQRLRRPPPGYVYEVWLVGESAEPLSLGTITGPKPGFEDIDDADVVVHEAFMTGTEILQAAKVVPIDILDLSQYAAILVTLEPKAGVVTMGPTKTLSGPLPEVCSVWICDN
ncbi:MAG: anti-sigma factor [Gemmatimonadota bacterium]|nr:MAG: anti-sigma factor [Gemmatimonadota bacterium]